LKHNPPDLCFLSNYYDRNEPLVSGFCIVILNKQKCHLNSFLLQNLRTTRQNKFKAEQVLPGDSKSERGEEMRKGCMRLNMVQIWYTHVSKWKKWKKKGTGERRTERNNGRGEFNYDILNMF
jgi:hypothetical protein